MAAYLTISTKLFLERFEGDTMISFSMMSSVTQGVLSKSTSTSMVSLLYELLTIRQITCQLGALAQCT